MAVQDGDVHLDDTHVIPLVQLWPTKQQDNTVPLNLNSTAEAIDMLRFFYNHVFMPWDCDEDDMGDWAKKHLESRLHLFYDMKNGLISKNTAERVRGLMTEVRRLQV